ncbi:hypothetical protein V866_007602 [Kwoniella sp. B9012]
MAISTTNKRKILGVGPGAGAIEEFKQLCEDYEVHMVDRGPRDKVKAEIKRLCETAGPFEAAFLFFANGSYAPMDEDLLGPLWQNGNKVGCFAQCGTGYDNVRVNDITAHGCYFTNTPDAVTLATADFTVLLFLSVLRGLTMAERAANLGKNHAEVELTVDPAGLTLGVIGLGRIGKDFVKKCQAFGINAIYHTRNPLSAEEEAKLDVKYATRDELCKKADVIAVLTPHTPETFHILDHEQFAMMKDGVFIINSSRGPTINEEALIDALKSNKVKRAALDVFENEPAIPEYFKNNPRVTITPHVAAYTKGTIYRGERDAMANVRAFFEQGHPNTPVNGPFQ